MYRIVTQVSRYVSHRDFRYRATPIKNVSNHQYSALFFVVQPTFFTYISVDFPAESPLVYGVIGSDEYRLDRMTEENLLEECLRTQHKNTLIALQHRCRYNFYLMFSILFYFCGTPCQFI